MHIPPIFVDTTVAGQCGVLSRVAKTLIFKLVELAPITTRIVLAAKSNLGRVSMAHD
jgi:hypothetical protein